MAESVHLVADIGGTNARFALVEPGYGNGLRLLDEARFPCREFPGLSEAMEHYLAGRDVRPLSAGISIAGPADSDLIQMTNLDWSFSLEALRKRHDLENACAINDAAAGALATTRLHDQELETVRAGQAEQGQPRINLIPGTGLGVGAVMPVNGGWVPIQGEGGHASIAPVGETEFEVIRMITRRFGRATGDVTLSGPGMLHVYQALAEVRGERPADIDAPEMTRRALQGDEALCAEALDTYLRLLGRLAGDLSLTFNSHGGVYLSGFLMNRLGKRRIREPFIEGFLHKGIQRHKVDRIPVYLVTREDPGLLGAAVWLMLSNDRR